MGEQNALKLAIALLLKTGVIMHYILSNVMEDRITIARSLQPKLLMHVCSIQ